ncbi:cobalamin synthesis protein P47K [Methanosalsum zhilinae DSM 4017]|uniref:Cobalamin synthesis protein P47K n=1 Tax=Methanosalsum zhilinae (strain DSM 4017 / NBRC 107636 / OCM 62 / WeN5) TaxID=679901 RepID=F7XKS7_METZD|nr:GTP-binding protein [Methanosalsum zhilinae]AEH61790.1 cobalamin synthesis protein P47K [Methanosalsum zhilinae DSM 4017]
MRVLIIGGFLGSGKTTTVLKLGKYLNKLGHRVAIIVNEIGEVGVDGEVISKYGFDTTELTSGCICCSLKRDMKFTVSKLRNTYNPDFLLIEPTGIAFPHVIRNEIMLMDIPDVKFAPLVTLIDGSRFKHLLKEVKHFSQRQIIDAEILVINKRDLIDPIELPIIKESVHQLNPDARVMALSAKEEDEDFREFIEMLFEDQKMQLEAISELSSEELDSIACSGIATYAREFVIDEGIDDLRADEMAESIIMTIKARVEALNPEFVGHIKIYLNTGNEVIKASVTAYYESPQIEVIEPQDGPSSSKLNILSAISNISSEKLIEIVESSIKEIFEEKGIHIKQLHTHDHDH